MTERPPRSKASRRADRATLVAYHEGQLGELLERVRNGFERFDAGEINAFELDDIIHHYKKAARELWKFCAVTGSHVGERVRVLQRWRAEDDLPDWWGDVESRRE